MEEFEDDYGFVDNSPDVEVELSQDELDKMEARQKELAAMFDKFMDMSEEELAKLMLKRALVQMNMDLESGMCNAATYNAIRSFLKDNNVQIVRTRKSAAAKLDHKLQMRAKQASAIPGQVGVDELGEMDISDFTQQ